MFRRLSLSVTLIACAATYVIAVERATFILTDGERKSGAVVYHGDQHENLINGFLNLGTDNGTEQTFPLNQVAIIDFVGGQPPVTELAQLGTEHMLVTRDGGTQQGRLVNLIGGDTLLWENLAKERQQFAIRDVSRVYLNPQSARTAFGYTAPPPPPAPAPGTTVRVDPRQKWTDTGLTVTSGDRLVFATSLPVSGLLGRIGNGAAFGVRTDQQTVAMRTSGRLMLGVKDDDRSTREAFSVVVSRP
jgi:hypothetical protein